MGGWRAWPSPAGGAGDGGNRPGNSWKPPSHSQSAGPFHSSIPLWEKKFCSDACNIPWKLLCQNQKFIGVYKNVLEWDDSGALEAFQNAKTRFWAHYHRVSCDIPLPDPEMYIDEVDPYGFVDPDLIADLEGRTSWPKYENANPKNRCLLPPEVAAATGWDDAENTVTDSTSGKCHRSNWDAFIERPKQVTTWDDGTVPSFSCWDTKNGSSDAWNNGRSGWDAEVRQNGSWGSRQMTYGNNNFGGTGNHQAGAIQDDSWNSRSKYAFNDSGGWGPRGTGDDSWCKSRDNSVKSGISHGHGCAGETVRDGTQRISHFDNGRGINVPWENRNLESRRTYSRKRDGGWSGSRASKMRYPNRVP